MSAPEIAQLVNRHQLGELRHTFSPAKMERGVAALYAGMTVVWFGLMSVATQGFFDPFDSVWGWALLVGPGLLMLGGVLCDPLVNRRLAARRLHLFEHGVVVHDPAGGALSVFRWDAVTVHQSITNYYRNGVYDQTACLYALRGPDGSAVKITQFYEKPLTWGPLIDEAVVRAQLDQVWAAVQRGEEVDFDAFKLSRTGISTGGNGWLAWSAVQEVQLKTGWVHVFRSGQPGTWASEQAGAIANLPVFALVAENLRG